MSRRRIQMVNKMKKKSQFNLFVNGLGVVFFCHISDLLSGRDLEENSRTTDMDEDEIR